MPPNRNNQVNRDAFYNEMYVFINMLLIKGWMIFKVT